MNYEMIKTIPTSRDGKMVFGIIAALIARTALNQGFTLIDTDTDGALMAFFMAGILTFTVVLSIVRYNTGRPLFEPIYKA
jgi:hypothetical protein